LPHERSSLIGNKTAGTEAAYPADIPAVGSQAHKVDRWERSISDEVDQFDSCQPTCGGIFDVAKPPRQQESN
jgi:hypothetical protein